MHDTMGRGASGEGAPPDARSPGLAPGPDGWPARGLEWALRSRALREAERQIHDRSPGQRELTRRAMAAHEGALRLLEPPEPLLHGDGAALALGLLREAAYWALGALGAHPPGALPAMASLLEAAPRPLLLRAAGGEVALASLVEGWLEVEPLALAELAPELRAELARRARGLVEALLAELCQAERQHDRLLRQRWVRLLTLAAAVGALLALGVTGHRRWSLPPDLAEGRPWQASSSYAGFNPVRHVCDGNRTNIVFHTNLEDSPWFEVDLGATTTVGFVEVRNRGDDLQDRAAPLAIEVSDDRKKWTEVARRQETFSTWGASFEPRQARFVRARALRKTFLHLEKLTVRKRG